MSHPKLVIGNWKMNGLQAARAQALAIAKDHDANTAQAVLCPPATLLADLSRDLAGTSIALGGQDCHPASAGPHTGDVSAAMLRDAGASFVILGHSELRRQGVRSDAVRQSAGAAVEAGLTVVVCAGESRAQRDDGWAEHRVCGQLMVSLPNVRSLDPQRLVVAYEPVWAIGSGRTPTAEEIMRMHAAIRTTLQTLYGGVGGAVRILYGGSVKSANAADLTALSGVDGVLVGGASLQAAEFLKILSAAA